MPIISHHHKCHLILLESQLLPSGNSKLSNRMRNSVCWNNKEYWLLHIITVHILQMRLIGNSLEQHFWIEEFESSAAEWSKRELSKCHGMNIYFEMWHIHFLWQMRLSKQETCFLIETQGISWQLPARGQDLNQLAHGRRARASALNVWKRGRGKSTRLA